MEYLGLNDFFPIEWRLCMDVLAAGVMSSEGGSCVEIATHGYRHAISSAPVPEGGLWSAEVHVSNNWLLLGVIGQVNVLPGCSYADRTSFGWGMSGQAWVGGLPLPTVGWTSFVSGDVAVFHLDTNKSRLLMAHQRLNVAFSIPLPTDQKTLYIHASMYDAGTKVKLRSLLPDAYASPAYAWARTLGVGSE
jgi:hypothetical protein